MKKFCFFACFALFFASCQTIHYTNKSKAPENYTYSQWHHIGLFGLLEFSDPVNAQSVCGDKSWRAVRTQRGFLQGLTPALFNTVLSSLGIPPVGSAIYTPEEVAVACAP